LQKKSSGIWLRSGASFVNIGEVLPDLSLLRLNIYDFDGHSRLRRQTSARHAWHDGSRWWLEDVNESVIVGQEITNDRLVTVKNMATGKQTRLLMEQFLSETDRTL